MQRKLFSSAMALSLAALMIGTATPASALVTPTPSTNDINRTNGWAHVDQLSKGIGTTDLKFISTRAFYSCFEYRTDGNTSQILAENGGVNYNTEVTDGLYPYKCKNNTSSTYTIAANAYVEVRMVFGAEKDERFDWTRFDVLPKPDASFVPAAATFCTGENSTLNIKLNNVVNLYGYQFKVNYDQTKVSATGAFDNSWFVTNGDGIPAGWDGTCAAGVCKFAVTKVDVPAGSVPPLTGSGTVAQVTFTGLAAGSTNVTFSDMVLTDRDGMAMPVNLGTATLTVCGFATVNGKVSLQGRLTPINVGTVTLTDQTGTFSPVTVNFSATDGTFTAPNIRVLASGTSYKLLAAHLLYLGNDMLHTLNPGDTYTAPNTRLLGGDANNSGKVDIGDLGCIGGAFGGAPTDCGGAGSSDINADTTVNIQDLSIAGGNYDKTTTQPW
jgi:hypothetical protein